MRAQMSKPYPGLRPRPRIWGSGNKFLLGQLRCCGCGQKFYPQTRVGSERGFSCAQKKNWLNRNHWSLTESLSRSQPQISWNLEKFVFFEDVQLFLMKIYTEVDVPLGTTFEKMKLQTFLVRQMRNIFLDIRIMFLEGQLVFIQLRLIIYLNGDKGISPFFINVIFHLRSPLIVGFQNQKINQPHVVNILTSQGRPFNFSMCLAHF